MQFLFFFFRVGMGVFFLLPVLCISGASLWLTPVPVYARRIKQVTLLDAGSRVEWPRNINRLKKQDLWYNDL